MLTIAHRLRAWFDSKPLWRVRRWLIVLYLLTAALDVAGKVLATVPAMNRAAAKVVTGEHAQNLRYAARPSGNFEIFRKSSYNLIAGNDLYAAYPDLQDQFKYSPTFALLFMPLAVLPWPIALFLWSSLNALMLFVAVGRVLPPRAAALAQLCLLLEVLRAMQNSQSNALVAALIIFAFAALERARAFRAAAAVMLGVAVKLFPLAALTFAIPRRLVWRTGLWAALVALVLVLAPLTVTPWTTLAAQYASWHRIEMRDSLARLQSLMEFLHLITPATWPNWPVQAVGTALLLAPLAIRRARWDDPSFRLNFLCSLLLYVVLFNHQAERASYVIAFTGATIWYFAAPSTRKRSALYGLAFVTLPLMSTLIPGAIFRTPVVTVLRLVVPCLLIWIAVLKDLLQGNSAPRAAERFAPASTAA